MPETTQHVFSHKEVVEALIEKLGIKEGIWGLYVEFGIVGANIGPDPDNILPTAVVPLVKLGLQRMPEISSISVDASTLKSGQAKGRPSEPSIKRAEPASKKPQAKDLSAPKPKES